MTLFVPTRRAFVTAGLGLFAIGGDASAQPSRVVRTRDGRVQGLRRRGVEIYLGLPYGASPGGARRFLPPAPCAAWRGVREATRLPCRSPQAGAPAYFHPVIGDYMVGGRRDELIGMQEPIGEDCLALNVLTPRADRRGRPVMVYLHGGGYVSGSGAALTLSEGFVAEQDIVLVTVNHRLGALGFAYLGGISSRFAVGNPGMLDLVAALTWVKDNIQAFGGDPNKVTIFGESGGGAKVALLMAMPQAAGLFRGAIIESGVEPRPLDASTATDRVRAFLLQRGFDPSNVGALQTLPVDELLSLGNGVVDDQGNLSTRLQAEAGPVADSHTLAATPWREAPAGAAHIPLLMGHCAAEASLFLGEQALEWTELPARLSQGLRLEASLLAPIIEAFRASYPSESARDLYVRMMSVGMFGSGMFAMADKKARQPAPVFYYRFEYDTALPPALGAFHTAELPLAMRMVLQPEAEALSRRIASAWANFARTGDPNGDGVPSWPRYDALGRRKMIFDREIVDADRSDREGEATQRFVELIRASQSQD